LRSPARAADREQLKRSLSPRLRFTNRPRQNFLAVCDATVVPHVVRKTIFSCEKNVFDGLGKPLFVISALHAEECTVAASAPM